MFILRSQKYGSPLLQEVPKDAYFVPASDDHSSFVLQNGYPEGSLIEWVKENFIRQEKVFVDIGAHMGQYTWLLAPYAKHVHAFEATPRTFCLLNANVCLKDVVDRVTLHNVALGPENGEAEIHIRSREGGGNGVCAVKETDAHVQKVKVPMRTLDSFGLTNVGFLKIDVEGYEKQVLMGAIETLRLSNWPPFIFESWLDFRKTEGISRVTEIREELFEYIKSIGYSIQLIRTTTEMYLATKSSQE